MRFRIGTKIGVVLFVFLVEILAFMFILFVVIRQYEHHVHELSEEIEEMDLMRSLQFSLVRVIMPANDFLIPGGDPNEPENFMVLSAKVEDLIERLDKLEFDEPGEREVLRRVKEKYLQIKAMTLQIFSISNAVGNIEAGRLMEKIDKIADNALLDMERFHQFVYQEINEAEAGIDRIKNQLHMVILVGVLFNIVLITTGLLFFRRTISSPIISLKDAALEIARGDLEKRVNIGQGDEIGELAVSFNKMIQNLKTSRVNLEQAKEKLEEKIKERTKDLIQAKELVERITEGIEEGIMLLDRDFKILWANKKMRDSSGLKEEDIIGSFCYKVTHHLEEPCKSPHDICPIGGVLKTGKPITVTHVHFDKKGNKFYAEVSAYPLKNEKGEVNQFIHVSRDITGRMKMLKELEKSRTELKARVEELEKFSKLTMGRELKMRELKKKIKELEEKIS